MTKDHRPQSVLPISRVLRKNAAPPAPLRLARPIDFDEIFGRHEGAYIRAPQSCLSARLQTRVRRSKALNDKRPPGLNPQAHDARQRAIVRVFFHGHSGTGAYGLTRHYHYISRDGVSRDLPEEALHSAQDAPDTPPSRARPPMLIFYSASEDNLDGRRPLRDWAREDRGHYRILVSAENGIALRDLREYIRDVMERAQAALNTRLQWIAVDHWNTDNPHTHILLRGRTDDGRYLYIPRSSFSRGFRLPAREAATERLGYRRPNTRREPLMREALAHRPSALDPLLQAQTNLEGRVHMPTLVAPNSDPDLSGAMRTRLLELKRMGLAIDEKQKGFRLAPDWRDRLRAMELHLSAQRARQHARRQHRVRGLGPNIDL